MSYSAGHILIMPKENWNNVTTYQILDAVRHDGKSYLSKINGNTNHTPSGSTDNYWFLFAEDGFTPSVTASKSGKDTTITYVNKSGSSTSHVFDGDDGVDGVSVTGITKTGSQTVDGRVVDTYTVTYSNSTTSTFQVVNGKDGTGIGDMEKSVYDKDNNGIVDGVLGNTELIKDTVGFTSKNLIPYPFTHFKEVFTNRGITFTDNGDGSIKMNGTATEGVGLTFINTPIELEAGNYVLSSENSIPTNAYLTIEVPAGTNHDVTNGNKRVTFTLNSKSTISNIRLYVKQGVTLNNLIVYPMLRKADIMDDTYEQYRKPVPQYIEDRIKDTVGWSSKNLFHYQNIESYLNGISMIDNGDGTFTFNGTATNDLEYVNLNMRINSNSYTFPNGHYIGSGLPSNGSEETYWSSFTYTNSNNTSSVFTDYGNGVDIILNGDYYSQDKVRLGANVYFKQGVTVNNFVYKPMLRKADDLSPTFEPYNPSLKQVLIDNKIIKGKNMIPYWSLGNKTQNGITFTKNADNTITANGTATGDAFYEFLTESDALKIINENNGLRVVGTGCPPNGAMDKYLVAYQGLMTGDGTANDIGNGVTFVFDKNSTSNDHKGFIKICSGQTVSNLVFKPMLRFATETDPTYEPYYIPGVVTQEAQNVLGAKNLLHIYSVPITANGVTLYEGKNGVYYLNGTNPNTLDPNNPNSGRSYFETILTNDWIKNNLTVGESYIISLPDSKSTDNANSFYIYFWLPDIASGDNTRPIGFLGNNGGESWRYENGEMTFILTQQDIDNGLCIKFVSSAGASFNNVAIYPMLRLASIRDNTYTPYAMTNRDITEMLTPVRYDIKTALLTAFQAKTDKITGIQQGCITKCGKLVVFFARFDKAPSVDLNIDNIDLSSIFTNCGFNLLESFWGINFHTPRNSGTGSINANGTGLYLRLVSDSTEYVDVNFTAICK